MVYGTGSRRSFLADGRRARSECAGRALADQARPKWLSRSIGQENAGRQRGRRLFLRDVRCAGQSGKHFAPLKKKAKEDLNGQNAKWVESLFWQLADITKEAQEELGVNGGILADFAPEDQRTAQEKSAGKPAHYQFPNRAAASTKKVHKTQYSGEVVVCDHWRAEFGEPIKNADQHFRLVYLTTKPELADDKITAALAEMRVAVCRPDSLSEETREALADLIAAENLKRNSTAPNQNSLRDYADNTRRKAIKAILKCQLDEFRRGKVLTQKGYGIPATEVFEISTEREADLAGRLVEKAYDTPLFSPKDLKKDFTDNDAKKVFGGLFRKEPAKAEKDAVTNFGVGLELTVKSHPSDFKPDASQALQKLRELIGNRTDVQLAEIKTAFCAAPYGLTEAMVVLYVCSLIKGGGYELALNPSSPITLIDQTPLAKNRLTTHALASCEWNAKLDKALLGARIVVSVQKGWNEVLPYARVLDDTLKTAATPDEEPLRNTELLVTLGKLATELPEVEKHLGTLAPKLGGSVPKALTEIAQRLKALASTTSFQEFDAAVRESYPTPEEFKAAFAQYGKARQLSDRAFDLSSARDYVVGRMRRRHLPGIRAKGSANASWRSTRCSRIPVRFRRAWNRSRRGKGSTPKPIARRIAPVTKDSRSWKPRWPACARRFGRW